ncbi:MAG: LamG-like jellyroll fold domain-containing protein [Bacteroidota bacterium]|nr:LamG-like jellyroll fold domain-containing protein [Bacteroidota bacterium]
MKNKLYKLLFVLFLFPLLSSGQASIQNLPFSPNGTVHCQKQVGSTLYIGGDFTSIDANTGSLAGLSLSTTATPLQLPFVNGTVNTIVSDGAGGYLIGGNFTSVGGQFRQNFARINANMTVHPMNVRFNGVVNKIIVYSGMAYAVGGFNNVIINNLSYYRNLSASINIASGVLSNWSANISSGYIYDAVLSGTRMFIGGYFEINRERRVLAAFDLNLNGALASNFRPSITSNGSPSSAYVYSLAIGGGRLFFGGWFNRLNNLNCSNVSSINISTNAPGLMNVSVNNSVMSLSWNNNLLYVGGHFTTVNNVGRPRLFAFNTSLNSVFNSWTPAPNSSILKSGIINNNLWVSGGFSLINNASLSRFAVYSLQANVNIPPILNTAFNPSPNGQVNAILPVNATSWIAGGNFNKISTAARSGALAINLLNNTLTNFAPNVFGSVRAIEVSGSNVFLGGVISRVNGNVVNNFAVVNSNSGLSNNLYRANFNGPVFSMALLGSQLFVGGQFSNLTVFSGSSGVNRNLNSLASLGLGSSSLLLNTGFNANLVGWSSIAMVKTIKVINGQLYVGGAFASPRNALAMLNPLNGAALPFNANIQYSYARVNDLAFATNGTLAVGGYIPYVNGYYTYNLAYISPSVGSYIASNNTGSFVSGMNGEIMSMVAGNLNDIMYVNSNGLYRTNNNNGATGLAFSHAGTKLSLSKIGTTYFMGGNFSYYNSSVGSNYFNFMAVNFIPPTPPTVPSSNITFTDITTNSMRVSWANGNGAARILMVRQLTMGTGHPVDFTSYYPNNNYGSGSNISGAFVMYNGNGNSAYIYNLQPGTKYDVKVVEYNGSGINSVYASNFGFGSGTTRSILPPTIGVTSIFANNITKNTMMLNFNSGNGNGRLVVAREAAPVNVSPSADILYSPSATFGYGSHLGNGNYVIARSNSNAAYMYGLKPGTTYYFAVYEYNNYGSYMWRYNYSQVASNNATTIANAPEPTIAASNLTVVNNGGGSVRVRWTKGNGSGRILLANVNALGGINSVNTTDGISYTANTNFNSSNPFPSNISVNNYGSWVGTRVVYNGTEDSTIIYGLNSNTTYNFILVEYNTLGLGSENYQQNAWATTFFTTPSLVSPPTIPASNVRAFASTHNQVRLSWNNGNGTNRIVVAKKGAPVNFLPATNVSYAANPNFGVGTNYNNGNFIVYNGNANTLLINNLDSYSDYHFSVYEYNAAYNYYTYQNETRYLLVPASTTGMTKPANWPRVAGGSGTDAAGGVVTDANGNVFTAGVVKGSDRTYFGITPIGGSNTQAFLSKHNSTGVLQWVNTVSGTGENAASTVTMDNSGNAYIVGSFRNTASFSNTLVTSNGSDDAYLAKYNNNGTLQWVRTMGGTGQDVAFWAKTDGNGDVIVTGYFHGTPSFSNSTQTLVSSGNSDIWIAKFGGSTGNLIWAVGAGGNSYDYGHSVTIGQNNSVIVAGEFKTTASFGSTQLVNNTSESRGFLAKLNNAGAWQWVIGLGDKSKALGVTADQNDNYYVVGGFTDSAYFNGQPFKSNGLNDAFISRVNTNGNIQWTNQIGGTSEDGASGVSIASDGIIHMVGTFADTCRFNAATTLTSAGGHDIFTTAFTNTGLLTQARRFGGPLEDKARAIHAISSSSVYLCGYFTGAADFGGFVMNATPSASSTVQEWDLFIHNIGSTYTPPASNNDLIAWYRFNNTLNDFSGNNFHGTSPVSPVYVNDRNNVSNNALSFNGVFNRVNFNVTKPEYDNISEFTYTSWVKLSAHNPSGYTYLLHSKITTGSENSYLYIYVLDGGTLCFIMYDAGMNLCGYYFTNPGALPLNTWTHIGLTFKAGNDTKLFLNGQSNTPMYSLAQNYLGTFNNKALTIGAYRNCEICTFSYLDYFNGTMDDVRLYKRALTQAEINDIRNASSAISAPPIEAKNRNLVSDEPSVLYPNPNAGSFKLDFNFSEDKSLSFRILDLSGKVILEEDSKTFAAGFNSKAFELTKYTRGYYILQVLENNKVLENHKLLIQE